MKLILLLQLVLFCDISFSILSWFWKPSKAKNDSELMEWTEEDSYLNDGWTVDTALRHYIAVYCEKFRCKKQIQNVMTTMADNHKYTLAVVDAADCQHNCRVEFSETNTTRRIAYLYVREVYLPKKKEYLRKAGLAF